MASLINFKRIAHRLGIGRCDWLKQQLVLKLPQKQNSHGLFHARRMHASPNFSARLFLLASQFNKLVREDALHGREISSRPFDPPDKEKLWNVAYDRSVAIWKKRWVCPPIHSSLEWSSSFSSFFLRCQPPPSFRTATKEEWMISRRPRKRGMTTKGFAKLQERGNLRGVPSCLSSLIISIGANFYRGKTGTSIWAMYVES